MLQPISLRLIFDLVNNRDRFLQRLPRMLQFIHRVCFAGNRRRRENPTFAQWNVIASLTAWLLSSLKFLGVMFLSRKVPYLFILFTHKMMCILQLQHSLPQNARYQKCDALLSVYMVVVKNRFKTSFEKYR